MGIYLSSWRYFLFVLFLMLHPGLLGCGDKERTGAQDALSVGFEEHHFWEEGVCCRFSGGLMCCWEDGS